jgi:hypothetical protein
MKEDHLKQLIMCCFCYTRAGQVQGAVHRDHGPPLLLPDKSCHRKQHGRLAIIRAIQIGESSIESDM